MASLLAELAAASTQANLRPTNKRVTVYAPGRGMPTAARAAPRRQGPAQRPSGTRPSRTESENRGAAFAEAEQAFLNSPAAIKQREQKAQKEAEDAAWDDKAWYEKGLGMVLGNPIVSNVLKPLSVLSTPGKMVVAGLEEALERTPLGHIQDLPDWAKTAMKFNPATAPLGFLAETDSARTEADDRSFWEKVKPDSDYGFGQLLDEDNPEWMNRIIGLTGDIATDPFTYVAPGATRMVGAIGKGAKVAEAAEATTRATDFLNEGRRLAKAGELGEAAKLGTKAAEQEALARRLTEAADQITLKKAPVHQGRKARAALIGEIAQENPALLERYGPELQRAGQRGFNTIKEPALREALGLSDPALRIGGASGWAVPKSRRLIEAGAEAGGVARAALDKAPILGKAGELFAQKGLEDPMKVLTRGAKGDPLRSATIVRIQNLMRRGAGEMEGRGNKALTDMVRQLKQLGGKDEIQALFRQAETEAEPNLLNKFFGQDLPALYEKVAGRDMGVKRNPSTYVPHMHTPAGRRFMHELDTDVLEDLGFVKDDLLEGSKYLEKSRKLQPDVVGTPKEFEIGDRGTITLTEGTVDELNEELGRLFPEFKGKFYEDDPVRIGEAYVSSISRQAGRDKALGLMAGSKNPLVREVTGELLADVEKRNEFLRRNPVLERVKEGYRAGQRILPVQPKGEMPATASDALLATTKHVAETNAQADYIMKQGKKYVADVGADVTKTRSTLSENLKGLRSTLMDGLKKKTDDAERQIRALNVQLERVDAEIKKLGPLTSENMDDLVATHQTIENHIATTKAEIKKINDRYGKKIPRDQARVDRELQKTLRHLEEQRSAVEAAYNKSSHEIRAEARARKTALEAPVEAAQVRLDQAEAALPPRPVPKQKVQEANARIRTNFESEDAFEADRQLYVAELQRMRNEGIPIYRTIDGRMTPETAEAVQAAVVETKKTTPPPPDIPTPPPAATVEPTMAPTPEDQLREAMARQAEPTAGGAPGTPAPEVAPPAPAAPDTKLVRQPDGAYRSESGWEVTKDPKGWRVTYHDDDFGVHPSLKVARKEVESQQEQMARTRAKLAERKAKRAEAAAAAATPEGTPSPEPAVPPPATTPEAEIPPTTKRLTRKWTKKDFHGTEIEVGPDGWTIEPFEESLKGQPSYMGRGYLPPKAQGPRAPWELATYADETAGPRRVRYVALDTYPVDHPLHEVLRNRSFASAREAKLAVEEELRRTRYEETLAQYQARVEARANPEVAATYENLAGLRTDLPTPTPEERAANQALREAGPAVSNLQRPVPGTTMGPNQLALTEEGAALTAMRPPAGPVISDPYVKAYDDWQQMLARSTDPSLTQAERNKAARTARSMGGEFTQTTGKHYRRHADEKILIDNAAWELERDYDLAVVKARQDYDKAVANADAQVEAIVYTKHNNPITGDEYRQLPSGSMQGFGPGEERVPVQVRPPAQGEVPTGGREFADERPWRSNYSQGERDADREVIDSGIDMMMMPENRAPFLRLRQQGEEIAERLDNAALNQQRLDELDEAAKRAYTTEVIEADKAVAEAKRAELLAEARDKTNEGPGTEQAWRDAQANTRRVVAEQDAARRAWMEADKAWKAALAERDEYLKAAAAVSSGERALVDSFRGEGAQPFIDAALRGESVPLVPTKVKGKWEKARKEIQDYSANLTAAKRRLDELDAAGRTFLSEADHRRLVGELNGIDVAKRELVNETLPQGVKQGREILPMRNFAQERQEGIVRPDQDVTRFDVMKPATVPPVQGTGDDLAARAYAASLSPTEPTGRGMRQARLQGKGETERLVEDWVPGTRPYEPRTEREAIAELERHAADVTAASPVAQEAAEKHRRLTGDITSETTRAENRKRNLELTQRAEQKEALAPLKDRVQTYRHVDEALNDKAKLIAQRDEAAAQRKVIVEGKVTKKADLVQIADDIEKVAKQNPGMLDPDMAKTEALLQDLRAEATRVNENDMTAKQVQGLIDRISNPRDNTLDIMLTTTGKGWKMLYDASGPKRAVLEKGDIILQADLAKQFTNVYEITKDKVLFGRTLNALTNIFKTYATLSPGFHVRNALSAIFMNATDRVALKTQLAGAQIWRDYMKAEDSEKWLASLTSLHGFSGDEIRGAFAATYGSGAGGRFTEAGFAQKLDTGHWSDMLQGLASNRVTRFSQRVGERVEGSVRLAMGLDSMRLGDDVESAIQRINRIHFDYGDVSKLDENMKRIIPFWTFMSRNMPMQVSQMWTHPQVYLGYQRFVKNFSATDEEYTPEYWTKAGAWNTGLKVPDFIPESFGGGLPISVQPDLGFTRLESDLKDYEDFLSGERLGGVLSAGNPLYTAPVEYATRTDLFTGQRFEEGETVPVGGIGGIPWRMLAKVLGQESGGEVDAAFMNAIRAVNPIQDRETRLLPQITGGDPEGQKRQLESWVRFLGGPARTLTPKQQDNEFFRRYYEQLDAAKLQQKRLQRQAG